MKTKGWMLATSGLIALAVCMPAIAQDVAAETSQDEVETVIVTGIRASLAASSAIKRDSKQIVDVITAEDVGKLPDNNVPEALAHVTGIQIERSHGEGSSVSIRGMTNVQTTLNGNDTSVGESRSMNLADIPAELLKSVTVYKTRSADQVEGGIAGTVNVDLRRPLDLDKGWTLAGSIRGVNASVGNTWSPYGSVLAAYRFDTSIGEMGVLLNVSYTQNNYFEDFVESESPKHFYGTYQLASLTTAQQSAVTPYAVNYGIEQGTITRPSVNLSYQWRVNDNLDFVVEGSALTSKEKRNRDRLRMNLQDGEFDISDATLTSDGGAFKSYTLSSHNGTGFVNGGPESYYEIINSDEFTTNFEANYHTDRWQISSSTQYNWSSYKYYGLYTVVRFPDATSASVDLASSKAKGDGAYIEFNNVDLSDVGEYNIYQFHDEVQHSKSQKLTSELKATYKVSDDWYLRDFTVGVRYTTRHDARDYGYRDANFDKDGDGKYPSMTSFECGSNYKTVKPDISGVDTPSWHAISGQCILSHFTEFREYLTNNSTGGADWSTAEPDNSTSLTQVYRSHEYTFGGYALANWAFTAGIPFNGQIGTRIVNTWGDVSSTQYSYDKNWNPTLTTKAGKKDYTDILPSTNAVAHFTDKLQMRLSYFYNIERPDFLNSSSWRVVQSANKYVYEGNPDLQPMREHNYDASLEYFFGKAGQLSLGYYLKKPHGWNYYSCKEGVYVEEFGENGTVCTYRNANPGTFEGFELTAQSFFDFLPGFWSNFGASANGTLMTSYKIEYPDLAYVKGVEGVYNAEGTSRYTYNLALYYDTPEFSARLAYNYRAKFRTNVNQDYPDYSSYNDATSRLDAAVNYTPYKWVTFSLEGTNLLEDNNKSYYGVNDKLPLGIRVQARTIQISARFRY